MNAKAAITNPVMDQLALAITKALGERGRSAQWEVVHNGRGRIMLTYQDDDRAVPFLWIDHEEKGDDRWKESMLRPSFVIEDEDGVCVSAGASEQAWPRRRGHNSVFLPSPTTLRTFSSKLKLDPNPRHLKRMADRLVNRNLLLYVMEWDIQAARAHKANSRDDAAALIGREIAAKISHSEVGRDGHEIEGEIDGGSYTITLDPDDFTIEIAITAKTPTPAGRDLAYAIAEQLSKVSRAKTPEKE